MIKRRAPEKNSIILHAPNVHTGGGQILLNELMQEKGSSIRWAQLDKRLELDSPLTKKFPISRVKHSIFSRFFAETRLWRKVKKDDTVLCFHSLPPLFPIRERVAVFIQNRLLLEKEGLSLHSKKARIRLLFERLLLKISQRKSYDFYVQTPSMLKLAESFLDKGTNIKVYPFLPLKPTQPIEPGHVKAFGFVYVADGQPHKNHIHLLEAWKLLNEANIKPSLALTVDEGSFPELCRNIKEYTQNHNLDLTNVGKINLDDIHKLYGESSALIYPSLTESLGLPLIEAEKHELPILASELDFVRDVVKPVETFDPRSPLSISRAVMRYLNAPVRTYQSDAPEAFMREILS